MWMTGEVELPDALISAHREGDLVIFVGAGVSVAPPSNLPLFGGLTRAVATALGEDEPVDGVPLDVFLGNIEGFGVHEQVLRIVGDAASKPNELHEALVRLAASAPTFRIVTTNYDRHVSDVAANIIGEAPREYLAPALPVGDDFEGIVYLHGSVAQPANELVVTDADFGRAYLTDAWAARFLERMFGRYTVLFVGYSHEDVVMTYLARGLRQHGQRYALADDKSGQAWKRLQIAHCAYPFDASHSALARAVSVWADRSEMDLLDHKARVSEIVGAGVPRAPDEIAYLDNVIADSSTVRFFTGAAIDIDWLDWATARPAVTKELFGEGGVGGPAADEIAWWFASQLAADEEWNTRALDLLRQHGPSPSPVLWKAIAWHIQTVNGDRPEWLRSWLVVLTAHDYGFETDTLNYILADCGWPGDRDVALMLLDHLLEARIQLRASFTKGRPPSRSVDLRLQEHWFDQAWTKFFAPNISELAQELLVIGEGRLRSAYRLLKVGDADRDFDELSHSRSAIEPHQQDEHGRSVDSMIDVLRDSLESVLVTDPTGAAAVIDRWEASQNLLLRRLAQHGWARREDRTPSQKLRFVIASGSLEDYGLRHEAFAVVAKAGPAADWAAISALVAHAEAREQDTDIERYERYNLLVWIERSIPRSRVAKRALALAETENPGFGRREHPDFNSWMSSGWVGSEPIDVDSLHDRVLKNPVTALNDLVPDKTRDRDFEGFQASKSLSAVVTQWPSDGLILFGSLNQYSPEQQLWARKRVVEGWAAASLVDDEWLEVLEVVAAARPSTIPDSAATLLQAATRQASEIPIGLLPLAYTVFDEIWDEAAPADDEGWTGEPLTAAINSWGGRLAEFVMNAISIEWKNAGEAWAGFPDRLLARLNAMIAGSGVEYLHAKTVLASQIHFLHAADAGWAEEQMLPLLNFEVDRDVALAAWDGFLHWGRMNDRLLEAGFLDATRSAFDHFGLFSETQQREFLRLLARLALRAGGRTPGTWLTDLVTTFQPEVRADWIRSVAFALDRTEPDFIHSQWDRWMEEFWTSRLAGSPRPLEPAEEAALTSWVPLLGGDQFGRAVDLSLSGHPGLVNGRMFFKDLISAVKDGRAEPATTARLVAHVLSNTEGGTAGTYHLSELFSLLAQAPIEVRRTIVNEALRLGVAPAASWLDAT